MKVAIFSILILGILPFAGIWQGDAKGDIGKGFAKESICAFSKPLEVQYPSPVNSSGVEKPCWSSEAPLPVLVMANEGQWKETMAIEPAPSPYTDHQGTPFDTPMPRLAPHWMQPLKRKTRRALRCKKLKKMKRPKLRDGVAHLIIQMLLLMAGDVEQNPGPMPTCLASTNQRGEFTRLCGDDLSRWAANNLGPTGFDFAVGLYSCPSPTLLQICGSAVLSVEWSLWL